jgi:hypothetical protein
VVIGGHEFFVTQNLNDALQHIRKSQHPVWMWADGICINQNDAKEREAQVEIMKDIYGKANMVTVFLGPGTDEGVSLVQEINRIGVMAIAAGVQSLNREELMDLLDDRVDNSSSEVKQSIFDLADRVGRDFPWKAYNELTKYDYWKRVWVFQEFCITAACRIMLGSEVIDFEIFAGAHTLLNVMTGRTLRLLYEENIDLGLKVLKENQKGDEIDQVSNFKTLWKRRNVHFGSPFC